MTTHSNFFPAFLKKKKKKKKWEFSLQYDNYKHNTNTIQMYFHFLEKPSVYISTIEI